MPDRFVPTDGGIAELRERRFVQLQRAPRRRRQRAVRRHDSRARSPDPTSRPISPGRSASLPAGTITVVEFYNAALDHYFMSPLAPDIDALDTGRFAGWARTGSHVQGVSDARRAAAPASIRCAASTFRRSTAIRISSPRRRLSARSSSTRSATNPNFSGYILRDAERVLHRAAEHDDRRVPGRHDPGLPALEPALRFQPPLHDRSGDQGADGRPRLRRRRLRTRRGQHVRQQRRAARSAIPGVGRVAVRARMRWRRRPPARCSRTPKSSRWSPSIPTNPANIVGVWQQDRWSNGGSRGLLTGYSFDGGRTWARTAAPFSRCAGGNAANGGDYERASDPWVTFAPDGTAYQISLSFSGAGRPAGLVQRDPGQPLHRRRQDMERSGHADPRRARGVQRQGVDHRRPDRRAVTCTRRGTGWPAIAARAISRARPTAARRGSPRASIFDPGADNQTLNNQIVVLPDGTLIDFFTLFNPGPGACRHSLDRQGRDVVGADHHRAGAGARRAGSRNAAPTCATARRWDRIAVGTQGMLVAAWQDSRFSGGAPRRHRAFPFHRRRPHVVGAGPRQSRPGRAGVLAHGDRTRRRNDRRHLLRLPQQHGRPHQRCRPICGSRSRPTA